MQARLRLFAALLVLALLVGGSSAATEVPLACKKFFKTADAALNYQTSTLAACNPDILTFKFNCTKECRSLIRKVTPICFRTGVAALVGTEAAFEAAKAAKKCAKGGGGW